MNNQSETYDSEVPNFYLKNKTSAYVETIFYILLLIFLIILVYFIFSGKNPDPVKESMTGGTLNQLYANDSQDVYLKSNVDQLATGNFNLYWNNPSRITDLRPNRGLLLPEPVPEPEPEPINFKKIKQMKNYKKSCPLHKKRFVDVNGNLSYFDNNSYVGSYWEEPNFDINKPYPIIPDSNRIVPSIKFG